jgi:hypothetical protein
MRDCIEELKSVLLAPWKLISQAPIDKVCEEPTARLELCLGKGQGSIRNDLWQISECRAMKIFIKDTHVQSSWTEAEVQELMQDW